MLNTKSYNALNLALPTNFRGMLQSGHLLWGTGCRIPSEESARIIATLPHHFCFIDTEHTPINATLLTTLIRTIHYTSHGSMVPIVRVAQSTPHLINYALNAGAGGVILAHVQTPTDARAFVRLAKFPPLGDRSYPPMALFGPQTETRAEEGSVYDVWNKHAAVFCQIEDVVGVENVAGIAAVEGVDGLMVGASDLRFSLGLEAGSPDGDEACFVEALEKIQQAADRVKVPVLGFAVTEDIVRKRIRLGWRALICHADAAGIFRSGTEGLKANLRVAGEVSRRMENGVEKFTLYGYERNPRTRIAMVVARAEEIEFELVKVVPRDEVGSAEYVTMFPLSRGKIPGLTGPGGVRLTETVAIASYLAGVRNKCGLLGDGSERQRAEVLSWMCWANEELLPTLARWFLPSIQFKERPVQASESEIKAGKADSEKMLDGLEQYLRNLGGKKYLVGDRVTVADVTVMIYVSRGLEWVLGAEWRDKHQNIMVYFYRLAEWEPIKMTIPSFTLVESARANGGLCQ